MSRYIAENLTSNAFIFGIKERRREREGGRERRKSLTDDVEQVKGGTELKKKWLTA